jgi:type II secretory pathway component PulF
MLDHAARLERELAEERVRAFVRLLEPALILLFGAVIALIAAALLQAVYGVRPVA